MRRSSVHSIVSRFVLLSGLLLGSLLHGNAHGDPEITVLQPREALNQIGFAESVATSGDTLVVGAPAQSAVFVFGRLNGRWFQRQRIASPASALDRFGTSVDIDGTRILIGAPGASNGDGAAYVFDLDRSRSAWTERDMLTVGSNGDGFALGFDVALDGDALAVSAPAEDDGAGVVYMFRPTLPDVWIVQDRVTPSDARNDVEIEPRFGTALDVDDGRMIASAPGRDGGRGAVYVFENSGRNWVERAKIEQPGAGDPEGLGNDVALDRDTIIAGASRGQKAYVFARREAGVELLAVLLPVGPEPAQAFGRSVALAGGSAIVADPLFGRGTGALAVFARFGDTYRFRRMIVPPDDARDIQMGVSMALDGDLLGVAAPADSGPEARAYAIDLRERTRGYLAPRSARFVPAPAKKAAPGLTVSGTIDLGPEPVNLALPGTLRVGDAKVFFGPLTQSNPKKPFVFDDGTTLLSIKPSPSGSSKATFVLRYTDVADTGISVNGAVAISIETTSLSAAGTVNLTDGVYTSGRGAADVVAPFFVLTKLKAKAKSAGKGAFKFAGQLAGTGEVPEAGPTVTIRFGDDFEETIPGDRFKRKKSKWTFKDGKARGVSSIVIDFAKGKVSVAAKRLSLPSFGSGPESIAVGIAVDGVSREANVTAVAKGTSIKY